jgi:hypothetical protein
MVTGRDLNGRIDQQQITLLVTPGVFTGATQQDTGMAIQQLQTFFQFFCALTDT